MSNAHAIMRVIRVITENVEPDALAVSMIRQILQYPDAAEAQQNGA